MTLPLVIRRSFHQTGRFSFLNHGPSNISIRIRQYYLIINSFHLRKIFRKLFTYFLLILKHIYVYIIHEMNLIKREGMWKEKSCLIDLFNLTIGRNNILFNWRKKIVLRESCIYLEKRITLHFKFGKFGIYLHDFTVDSVNFESRL